MKTIKLFLKPITYLLAFLILFQGCTVYKSKPVTLDEAVKANTKVRIETKNDQTIKYKRIEFENGQYYGTNKSRKAIIKTPIKVEFLESVKIKDKLMSTLVPIVIPLMVFVAIYGSGRGSGTLYASQL